MWGPLFASLPEYRLSKVQRAMPAELSEEIVARYLLDVPGARLFVSHARLP